MQKITIGQTGQQAADLLYANDLEAQARRYAARAYAADESATIILEGVEFLFRSKVSNNNTSPQVSDLLGNGANWALIGSAPTRRFTTAADANTAVSNLVVNGRNLRDGIVVYIGTGGTYAPYWWSGGFADTNLIKYIPDGAALTDAGITKDVNLTTGTKQVGAGIIYNTQGNYAANASYDSIIVPLTKNQTYYYSGFTSNGFSAFGLYRKNADGTYSILTAADNYLFSWFNGTAFLIGAPIAATGNFKAPNLDGIYFIANVRYTTNDTSSTFVLTSSPITGRTENEYTLERMGAQKLTIADADIYFSKNQTAFDTAAAKAFINKSSVTRPANLYVKEAEVLGWQINRSSGLLTPSGNYDLSIIPVLAGDYVSISGDVVGNAAPAGGGGIAFMRLVNGVYTVIPDSELPGYYNISKLTTNKAFIEPTAVRPYKTLTLMCPVVTGDLYMVIITRFATNSSKDTLFIEKGKHVTIGKSRVNDIFGYLISHLKPKKWHNKNAFLFGDSVMASLTDAIKDKTDFGLVMNYAVSGATVGAEYNNAVNGNYDYAFVDVAVIMLGHNGGVSGSIADIQANTYPYNTNATTYNGYANLIEYIWSKNSAIKIYICTVHQTDRDSYLLSQKVNVMVNDLAAYYKIPLIDVGGLCGINRKNMGTLLTDGTHLTAAGIQLLADAISNGLERL